MDIMKSIFIWLTIITLSSAYYATIKAGDLSATRHSHDILEHLLDLRDPMPPVIQYQCCDWYRVRNMIKIASRGIGVGMGAAGIIVGYIGTMQESNVFAYVALASVMGGGFVVRALDYKLDRDEQRYAHLIDDNDNQYEVI